MDKPDSPSSKSANSNCSSKDNASPKNNKYPNGRYCHIVKRPDFDGYGFNLHSEKIKPGQYIGKVDPESPAEAAGLREGDQIIEVNGVNIGVETHKQVVQRIKAISNEVRLFLVDPSTENVANLNKHAEKNSNKSNNNNNNSKNSPAITESPLAAPATTSTVTIVPMTTTSPDYHNDKVTSISMVSTKSHSVHSSTNSTKDETDFNSKPSAEFVESNNGYVISTTTTVTNGKTNEVVAAKPTITTTPPPPSPSASEEQKVDSSSNNQSPVLASQNSEGNATSQSRRGLNLNLTAAEMRAKLLAKKKFDPKNDSVDLKKKFDIIQKL